MSTMFDPDIYEPFGPRSTYRRVHPRHKDFEYHEIRRRDILIVACHHAFFPTSLDPGNWTMIGTILATKFSTRMDGYPFLTDWVRGRYEQLKQTEDAVYLEWKDAKFNSPRMTQLRQLEGLGED
ncbi:MAG: hypothetical protein Q9191_005824 [Dirinaria sp. TL-2023a]